MRLLPILTSARRAAVFLGLALAAFPYAPCGLSPAAAHAQTADVAATIEPLAIATKEGVRQFSVEVMRSDAEREKGLMFRRFLPDDRGMLFDFKTEQSVMMWMKNTYLSLDMIFIRRDGTIARIAENTEPLSERIIPSGGPVFAVLEVKAGTSRRLGIATGDKVTHPMFER